MKSLMKFAIQSYNKIPIGLLNIAAPVYNLLPDSVRFTKTFSREWNELERISALTDDEIEKEQEMKLQKIINYAYEHVPYYKKLFDKNGIEPGDIMTRKDLEKIPLLSKNMLMEHREELLSDEYRKEQLIHVTSSGTTGVPVGFYVEKESHMRDWAYMYFMFRDYGLKPKSKRLVLRGKPFKEKQRGKKYQWDAFKRELSIDIFSMNEQSLEEYCKAIEKYKPEFAHGYMSAMYTLCKYIEKRPGGLKHRFKGFIATSEMLVDEQRNYVETILGMPVLTFYGMSERVIWATQRHSDQRYIVAPLYGVTEIVDSDGKRIEEANQTGELVGTGLLNYGMPLIRYKTGDMCSWSERGILNTIQGRSRYDQFIAEDGSYIPVAYCTYCIHSDVFKNVIRYQLYQEKKGEVIIKVVPAKEYTESDSRKILKEFEEKTEKSGGQLQYRIKIVSEIVPKKNGKLLLVDQRLKL